MPGTDSRLSRRRFIELGAGAGAGAAAALTGGLSVTGIVDRAIAEAAAQAGDVPREETLVLVGVGGEAVNQFADVENVNVFLTNGSLSRSGYQVVYEPLAMWNMLQSEEQMWLAEGYEYNADFTELTVKIKPGILWSDGTPFTANDPAFTLTMLRDAPATVGFAVDMNQWVADAVAVDDLTLRVTLKSPNPRFFFNYLTHHADNGVLIMPRHIWEGQDPTTFTNYDLARGWPIATGPYRLVASSQQQKVWDRRDDWWGAATGFKPLPAPRRLIFLPALEESRMAQLLLNNEADITLNLTPANMQTVLTQGPHLTTHTGKEPPYGYVDWWPTGLGFNCLTPPFDDPEIRWAISYAINREQLVQFAFRGAGQPTTVPFPYYPSLMTFIEGIGDLLEQYPTNLYDPERTAEILTRKGFTRDGDGPWTRDGQTLSVPITTFQVLGDVAPIVSTQLQQAGIESSFQLPTDFYSRISLGEAPAWLFGHGGSVRDPYFTLRLYHSRYVKPTGEQTSPFYRWSNAEFDAVVDRMGNLGQDDPQLMDLFREAMAIWLPNLPDVQLVQFYHRIPMNTTYWTNWPSAENEYMNEAFWHRTFLAVLTQLQPAAR